MKVVFFSALLILGSWLTAATAAYRLKPGKDVKDYADIKNF